MALYYPDLSSLRVTKRRVAMTYLNLEDETNRLVLEHFTGDGSYTARKYLGEESVQFTTGRRWETFFMHLTIAGLARGETCRIVFS